jgi:hypothetical protein
MQLPEAYVIQKLFSFAQNPTYHKNSNQYNAGCPICKEGRSTGRKKRLYYYTKTNSFYCFNCNKNWNAFTWIKEAGNLSAADIKRELQTNNYRLDLTKKVFDTKKQQTSHVLPFDSINLFDNTQLHHYQNSDTVQKALSLIKERNIANAVNKPKALYISLKDFIHKNRICIPFYDQHDAISFYQTRSLYNEEPKYLSKLNADKTLYGINNIDPNVDYIFIFEGPIDAMFVKNGVAATGLSLTSTQTHQLNQFPLHKKIWVPDNQNIDAAAKQKTDELLNNGSSVFTWPKNILSKDFNELALLLNQNSISHKFILNNTKIF